MNAWDLMQELGEIDSDLLEVTKPKKTHRFRPIVLIAATMILLIGMVMAVGGGVKAKFSKNMIRLQGLSLEENKSGEQTYFTAQITYDLQCVQVQNLSELCEKLTSAWENFDHEREQFYIAQLREDDGSLHSFSTLQEAECFLGLKFAKSALLEERIDGVYLSMVVTDCNRAAEEFQKNHTIAPDGLLLYCPVKRVLQDSVLDATLVSECGIEIYVALQDDFASGENRKCVYSHETEGAFRESGMLTQQGSTILLMENAPNDGYVQTGYAAWCKNGIGYLAHIKVYPDSYATPLSIMTPLLSQMN